jgi:hypothetical protein
MTNLLNLKTIHFCTYLHFSFFSVLFCWENRERVVGFRLKQRKWSPRKILTTITVDFCVKMFYMIRGVTFRCLFTLKTKTTYLSSRILFVSGGFQVLGHLIGFLIGINWFNKVSRVFSRCSE